mgnify:CR=1 FL=1
MPINWNAPIEIRDGRNGNWFWVDKIVWQDKKLSSSDKVVYGTLAYFANNRNQQAFPSYIKIEEYSGVSERQCYRCIKNLEKLKYIQIKRRAGRPNLYTLLDTPAKYAIPPLQNKVYEQELTNNNYLTKENSLKRIKQLKDMAYKIKTIS